MPTTEPASFLAHRRSARWIDRSAWPFAWVSSGQGAPTISAYRLRFTSAVAETLRLVVTADERYRLFCDGRHVASGPEIGTRWRWQADAIPLDLAAGEHQLLAIVWSVGAKDGDYATDGIAHGFALGVDGAANARLATGTAPWEWHALPGYTFRKSKLAHWTVPDVFRDAKATDWAEEGGGGDDWHPVQTVSLVHHIGDVEVFPARLVEVGTLPPQTHRPWTRAVVAHAEALPHDTPDRGTIALGATDAALEAGFAAVLAGGSVTVPAHATVRVVIDCGDYLTAWPELSAGGEGGEIEFTWMEALSLMPVTGSGIPKGQRDQIAGRFVGGPGDVLRLDGEVRAWRPLYWRAGRFLIVTIVARSAPVVIPALSFIEVRYPLEQDSRLDVEHAAIMRMLPLCLRTLQANAHDQFSDTPYYERMQYLGDARIDCLNLYVLSHDMRLAAKALRMADAQRMPDGLTVSRTPTRNLQVIPTFSLFYVGMVRDHLFWRGDHDLVRALMPGVRGILDRFLRETRGDGTIGLVEGWNFCDWAEGYPAGEPPGTLDGSGPMNLQVLIALRWAEDLEAALGEPELAARWRRLRLALAAAVTARFWDDARGAWRDGAHERLSQQAQALAALCPDLDAAKRQRGLERMSADPSLVKPSLYFTHYIIEALASAGDGARVVDRLGFWTALPAQGFITLPEGPEPSRSDCHAWCAHPLFHVAATIAGIRPTAAGFSAVRIAPCPGPIPSLAVRIPHPGGGWITAELQFANGSVRGAIGLPEGVNGVFVWNGRERALAPGVNELHP